MEMPRSIIAMKGPPFTRKTEFATLIGKSLKCPVLSLDDALDVLNPDAFDPRAAPDVAFDILCRMASSHLFKGAFDNVVIDSPLSTKHQVHLLIKLAKSFSGLYPQSGLVIVECKPGNNYSWKLKFESYLQDRTSYSRKWYKPTNWDDIEKAVRCSFDEIAGGYHVSKLVLDPLLDLPNFFVVGSSNHPLLMNAIRYMTPLKRDDGANIMQYSEWLQSQYKTYIRPRARLTLPGKGGQADLSITTRREERALHNFSQLEAFMGGEPAASITTTIRGKERLCKDGHCIIGYLEEGVDREGNCTYCEEKVTGGGAAYTCKDCNLALHKDCAESRDSRDLRLSELPVSRMHACSSCKKQGKRVSRNCATCLFETNLKARIMPTIIRNDCEKHFLSLVIPPVKNEGYLCAACGGCDMTDSYSCKICNLAYHFECLTDVPPRLKHEHGGHHHHMRLNYSTTIEEEDYWCPECSDLRDPQLWYYSCEDCPYEVHLYCVLPRKERMPQPFRVEKPFAKSSAQRPARGKPTHHAQIPGTQNIRASQSAATRAPKLN